MLWLHSASRPNSPAKTRLSVYREELWLPGLTRNTRELQSNSLRNLNNLSPFTFIRGRSLRIANCGLRTANLKAKMQDPGCKMQKAEDGDQRTEDGGRNYFGFRPLASKVCRIPVYLFQLTSL